MAMGFCLHCIHPSHLVPSSPPSLPTLPYSYREVPGHMTGMAQRLTTDSGLHSTSLSAGCTPVFFPPPSSSPFVGMF